MTYFDTSVLVTALVEPLPNHEKALACLASACRAKTAFTSTHALAESYSTLSALPLPRRIPPLEARRIVTESIEKKLRILPLSQRIYRMALDRTAEAGFSSGAIHDALHLSCAEQARCTRLFTFNLGHFLRLSPHNLSVLSP